MTLLEILNEILIENRVDFLRNQFVEKQGVLTLEDFNKLVELDESPRHKYLQALIRWFVKYVGKADEKNKERERLFWEDLYKINEYLDLFDRHKKLFSKKDIFQYSYEEFKREGAQVKRKVSQMDIAKAKKGISKNEKYKEFYVGNADGYDVYVIPKGRKDLYGMSCELGSGTEWCTATGKTRQYFDHYIEKEPLFIIIKGDEKYQFAFVSEQFMDEDDREISDLSKFKNVIKLCLNSKWIKPVEDQIYVDYYFIAGEYADEYDGDIIVPNTLVYRNKFIITFPRIVHGNFECIGILLESLEGAPEKVDGNFVCSYNILETLNGVSKEIGGGFVCSFNKLKTLKGVPKEIGGDFFCNGNKLTTLEDAPEIIGGSFDCRDNFLKTLKGTPKGISGYFLCSNNHLTTLEGVPEKVDGDFFCDSNELTTLKGAPEKVGGRFNCSGNQLTSLQGAPKKVGSHFICSENQLTTLEGAPEEIKGDFHCDWNRLTTLEGAPKKVNGNFYIRNNRKKFTKEEVRAVCDVGGKIYT